MSLADLVERSNVLKARIKAEGKHGNKQLPTDIVRLADIAEYELGYEAMLHRNLATVRSFAQMHHALKALAIFDGALSQFNGNVNAEKARSSGAQLSRRNGLQRTPPGGTSA
ncbi:hypothetical protein [Caballeronia sp. RCC_10]|uniref:hypothetical protein n=1 Tax=Caballeronia sp. RCC_10 TaxID=3239227 RepID=UPI003525A23A